MPWVKTQGLRWQQTPHQCHTCRKQKHKGGTCRSRQQQTQNDEQMLQRGLQTGACTVGWGVQAHNRAGGYSGMMQRGCAGRPVLPRRPGLSKAVAAVLNTNPGMQKQLHITTPTHSRDSHGDRATNQHTQSALGAISIAQMCAQCADDEQHQHSDHAHAGDAQLPVCDEGTGQQGHQSTDAEGQARRPARLQK